jgi:hypothetical protein
VPQPKGSWTYRISDSDTAIATITPAWFFSDATIDHQGTIYNVTSKFLSYRWKLHRAGEFLAKGYEPSPFLRVVNVTAGELSCSLRAKDFFTRSYEIELGGRAIGRIAPQGIFTRRATIDCDELPVHLQLFSFCIVVLRWRSYSRVRHRPWQLWQ